MKVMVMGMTDNMQLPILTNACRDKTLRSGANGDNHLSLCSLIAAFWSGLMGKGLTHQQSLIDENQLRESLSEDQIDCMIEDSFPASDPPSTY